MLFQKRGYSMGKKYGYVLPAVSEIAILNSISGNGKDPMETITCDESSMQSTIDTPPGPRLADREGTHNDIDVGVLLKDGYRDAKGKEKLVEPSSLKSSSSPAKLINVERKEFPQQTC